MKSLESGIREVEEWLGPGTLNFFGKPFAGKDTQAEQLANRWGITVIGGGDILRNSTIPNDVRSIMEKGDLIPSDRYEKIVLPYLGQTAFAGKPLLLSSVGRMSGEEPGVISATETSGHPIKAVLYLDITEDEAFRRLNDMPNRGRADDNPESLRNRFDAFNAKTIPVLDTYESAGLLVRINAMAEKDVVFQAMVYQLHERAISS